jgi:hypothetical protein
MIYQALRFEIKAAPIDRNDGLYIAVAFVGSGGTSEECEMRAVLTTKAARRLGRMLERVGRAAEHHNKVASGDSQ